MSDLENVQEVFPGAQLHQSTQLAERICLLIDGRVHTVNDGIAYVYKIDSEGFETNVDEPLDSWPVNGNPYRTYHCENCGYWSSGEHSFETFRQHLGKRNMFLQPFASQL